MVQLNGRLGTCSYFDSMRGRWIIHLRSGEQKAFKPENLELLPHGFGPHVILHDGGCKIIGELHGPRSVVGEIRKGEIIDVSEIYADDGDVFGHIARPVAGWIL